MKVTYNWLKEYADFDASPQKLVEELTMLGLEVDELFEDRKELQGVVVGEVVKKERHQNADKLSVCEVDIGAQRLTIVCGAPNVAPGQKVPVATPGTKLAGGMKIKATTIRGVDSHGMICSEAELGLTARRDGIMVLDSALEVGRPVQDLINSHDHIIDIDVTPNRPDCFGAIGIARDVAAGVGSPLRKPEVQLSEHGRPISEFMTINILDPQKCPRYTARFIGDVKIKPSPLWLSQRLEQIGIRSINNVVDVTNYVMMETGQPLHAFDYDLLAGHEINVKCAQDGQQFTTLDGKTHVLHSECLLICDRDNPVAIGGIMGGLNSEVSANTANILLESAYFSPTNIRRSCKRLGVSTESSKRFERGVDPSGAVYALDRATQLIAELTGGTIAPGLVDEYPRKIAPLLLTLRPRRVHSLLGVEIPVDQIKAILSGLDFRVSGDGDRLSVEVPTFRPDVTREADLIEEVGRIFGYNNIPTDSSALIEQSGTQDLTETFTDNAWSSLVALGFSEVVTFNLMNESQARPFLSEGGTLMRLINPLSEDLATLRPSLVPQLLNTLRWNLNRHSKDLKFFEIGSAFTSAGKEAREHTHLTGVLTGKLAADTWKFKAAEVDFYYLKGTVEHFLRRNKIANWTFQPGVTLFACQDSLAVVAADVELGHLGEIRPEILTAFEIEQRVFFFHFDFERLFNAVSWHTTFEPIPKFPPINRDLAIVIDDGIESGSIIRAVKAAGGNLLKNVRVFDVFRGEQIGRGRKSLALSLTFCSLERTLREQDVDQRIEKILRSLASKYSAQLRN
ncbi:MAG: phenylalanine--tRNA ligase subunit beta [bacterium]